MARVKDPLLLRDKVVEALNANGASEEEHSLVEIKALVDATMVGDEASDYKLKQVCEYLVKTGVLLKDEFRRPHRYCLLTEARKEQASATSQLHTACGALAGELTRTGYEFEFSSYGKDEQTGSPIVRVQLAMDTGETTDLTNALKTLQDA